MGRVELKSSGVVFNETAHTYHINGKELSGITGMLSRQLFEDREFEGIPFARVEAAAQYGTEVHKAVQRFNEEWIFDGDQETADYIRICKENNFVCEANEYNVSDFKNWSSNIDIVFRASDTSFHLADLKTFAVLDADRLLKSRFQLSIYAMFFESQNPGAQVENLYIIRLRNKMKKDGTFDHVSELIPVSRIPSEICQDLLDTDLRGEKWHNPLSDVPEYISTHEAEIRELLQTKTAAEERLAEIKTQVLSLMEAQDIRNLTTDMGMKLTRKLPSLRSSFDFKAFKADNPDADYSPYMKVSEIAGCLSIAV